MCGIRIEHVGVLSECIEYRGGRRSLHDKQAAIYFFAYEGIKRRPGKVAARYIISKLLFSSLRMKA